MPRSIPITGPVGLVGRACGSWSGSSAGSAAGCGCGAPGASVGLGSGGGAGRRDSLLDGGGSAPGAVLPPETRAAGAGETGAGTGFAAGSGAGGAGQAVASGAAGAGLAAASGAGGSGHAAGSAATGSTAGGVAADAAVGCAAGGEGCIGAGAAEGGLAGAAAGAAAVAAGGGTTLSASSSVTSKSSSTTVLPPGAGGRDGGVGFGAGRALFSADAGFSAGGVTAFFAGVAADPAPSAAAGCFNSGGGWPPIHATSSRPGSSMRASHSVMPGSLRPGDSPAWWTFSTIAFARKQCLPSLSTAVRRMGVSTGRGVAVRRKKRRVLSSGWRARTSSSFAQGSFTWSATPVFFEPPGFEGSAGVLPPTASLSVLACAVPRNRRGLRPYKRTADTTRNYRFPPPARMCRMSPSCTT